jgi:hypothetical protein
MRGAPKNNESRSLPYRQGGTRTAFENLARKIRRPLLGGPTSEFPSSPASRENAELVPGFRRQSAFRVCMRTTLWPPRQVRSKSPAGTRSSNADPDGPASLARLRGHTRASLEHSRFAARCPCTHPGKARRSLGAYAPAYPGRSGDHARSPIGKICWLGKGG